MKDQIYFNTQISGNGPPLVWGHGLMSSMAHEDACGYFDWQTAIRTIRLLRYDARGHGGSGRTIAPEDYHWSALAEDMIHIATATGMENFSVGGRSMGCATALHAGLEIPEKISKLVLANPPTAWETRAAQEDLYERMARLVTARGIEALIQAVRAVPSTPAWLLGEKPELTELFVQTLKQFDAQALVTILSGAKACDFPHAEVIQSLPMPTLILAWVDDPAHPLASAQALASLIPNGELVVSQSWAEVSQWTRFIVDFLNC